MTLNAQLDVLRDVVIAMFPELATAEFSPRTAGWDCFAVAVDDRWIFKLPRRETAQKALVREAQVLAVIRPAVTMPVPDMQVFPGPPMFSRHRMLEGEHLVTADYDRLPETARDRLAADMARFYAELHRLDMKTMEAAGARPISTWLEPEVILRRVWPVLPAELRSFADRTITQCQQLTPDPHGVTFGYFDGHGWNMAFDLARQQLNGIYDFGDCGFGSLHREFIYSDFISTDLTGRIIAKYEGLTGRVLDRRRITLLSGVLRFMELAEFVDDPGLGPTVIQNVLKWAAAR